jgi:ABC-type Zn uptake system ZnuABC Zn-binding protein ZnuA
MEAVLQQLNSWNTAQFASVPAPPPPLASGHRAFASLAQAYGLRELALVDAHSSSETLRPEEFRLVVEQLRTEQVPQLFAEQLPAPRTCSASAS